MNKKAKDTLIYVAIIVLLVIGFFSVMNMMNSLSSTVTKTNYSDVMVEFDNYNVSQFSLDLGSGALTFKVKGSDEIRKYTVPNVNVFLNDIIDYRKNYN